MKKDEPTRCYIYRCIGSLMFIGVIALGFYGKQARLENTLLIVEVWVLTLFGIGWFVAGTYKAQNI